VSYVVCNVFGESLVSMIFFCNDFVDIYIYMWEGLGDG